MSYSQKASIYEIRIDINLVRKELQNHVFSIISNKLPALTTRLQSAYQISVHTVQSLQNHPQAFCKSPYQSSQLVFHHELTAITLQVLIV